MVKYPFWRQGKIIIYSVLTELENKSSKSSKLQCISFQVPNNVAAGVFNNVEDVTCNKQDINLTSLNATHEESEPLVILLCKMSLPSTIVIASNVCGNGLLNYTPIFLLHQKVADTKMMESCH